MQIKAMLLCVFCLFGAIAVQAQPKADLSYKGNRIEITNVKLLKHSKKCVTVALDVVNTGRNPVLLHPLRAESSTLVVFDATLLNSDLLGYQTALLEAVYERKASIKAGEVLRNLEVKLKKSTRGQPHKPLLGILQLPEKTILPSTSNIGCADLIIDSIRVVKLKKNEVILEFSITNIGTSFADIGGVDKQNEHNLSVNVFFASVDHYTKGALNQPGFFIKLPKKNNGILLPGAKISIRQAVDIETMTRFSNIVLLQLDPLLEVPECLDRNNEKSIQLKR